MNDPIDMTTANPYLISDNGAKELPQGVVPTPLNMKPVVFTGPALASNAMEAFAAMRQQQAQLDDDDYDDHTMNCSTYSNSEMSGDSDSYWSDSSFSDDEADDEYIMYAPTAGASRGHMLRPMSLDQIQALAVATGARKPGQLQSTMNLSAHPFAHPPASSQQVQGQAPSFPQQKSLSMPDIGNQMLHYKQMTAGQTVVDPTTGKTVTNPSLGSTKPDDRLQSILQANNKQTLEYRPYTELPKFFVPIQPQHVEAFQADIINAVRGKSVEAIQALHQQGKMMQCCNKFGESIVHMACRQSSAEVLEYLMTAAQVNIRVCCDSGRTPLHDACWTTVPDFDIILLLLKECPDLLKIKDKRGFTPLAYVPHGQWAQWGNFLEEHKDLLVFREIA